MFSRRSAFESEQNRLSRALAAARRNGRRLIDLTVSNPARAGTPRDAGRLLLAFATPGALDYSPEPFGLETARTAVSTLWKERGLGVSAERVVMTASTSEAYSFAFKLLCDPGDEVLVPAPSYPLFEQLAQLEGVRLGSYRLDYDGAWFIDPAAVESARTPHTRAIVVVSPNNPTGSYLKRSELAQLAALGLPLISDEVFAEYPLVADSKRARSALETSATLVLALDGLSKLAALPGLKLGWITLGGPEPQVTAALDRLEQIADAFLSPNTPVQLALPALLETRATARDAIRARLAANHALLQRRTAGSELTPLFVEGGWYAMIRLPAALSDEDWALRLVEHGVHAHPGYFFDHAGPPCLVVSLLTPEREFDQGLARLAALVAE